MTFGLFNAPSPPFCICLLPFVAGNNTTSGMRQERHVGRVSVRCPVTSTSFSLPDNNRLNSFMMNFTDSPLLEAVKREAIDSLHE